MEELRGLADELFVDDELALAITVPDHDSEDLAAELPVKCQHWTRHIALRTSTHLLIFLQAMLALLWLEYWVMTRISDVDQRRLRYQI